jgi:hypothetical protein
MSGKQSGLGDNFYVTGYDLSGDVNSLGSITRPHNVESITGINKLAYERKTLQRDGHMDWVSYFNPAASQAHPVLSALPRTDVVATYFNQTALGNPAASLVGKEIDYGGNRNDDGSLRMAPSVDGNAYALDWGRQLTAGKRTDTSATNGSSIDTAASKSFGAVAYLHVFDVTATDVTIKIQDSANDTDFTDVTGLAFTALDSADDHTAERIAIGNTSTVRRYIRVVTATTGGFTTVTFACMIKKHTAAGFVV